MVKVERRTWEGVALWYSGVSGYRVSRKSEEVGHGGYRESRIKQVHLCWVEAA